MINPALQGLKAYLTELKSRPSLAVPLIIVVICTAIEIILILGDMQVLDGPRFRARAYEYGGFWPGLLDDWPPNYPQQPFTMFLTYGFFHIGIVHLAVNMFTMFSLGRFVVDRVGGLRFLVLYIGCQIGGAAGLILLSETLLPMVGASGALFGLAGALLAWNYVDRFTVQERLWPVARVVFLLILINAVMWWAMDGHLAWQTHLGGFVAGWIVAMLIDPRSKVDA